ncbi:MAG: hypothetical protein OEY07_06585 [Gammaproteobacteria bacterium]|nr:hypothetical protein [Gammaproteobacteria bacterium]
MTPRPTNRHFIEVDRLGYRYSVVHTCNGRLMFVASYEKEMDALRTAAILGTSLEHGGNEVCLNVKNGVPQRI